MDALIALIVVTLSFLVIVSFYQDRRSRWIDLAAEAVESAKDSGNSESPKDADSEATVEDESD